MLDIIVGSLVAIVILAWISYSVLVIIYLNILTRRYLTPISKDNLIKGNLKSYEELVNQYKDTDTLSILVLSGGGVRGLVPLHILAYIEQRTGKKTGELFDFISGTSTGAISALGLSVGDEDGNYKFSAKDILRDYEANCKKIFSSPWYHQLLTCFGLFAPRFLPDNKLSVLDSYCDSLTIGEVKGNMLIPVYNMDQNTLQIVKNWSGPQKAANENFLAKDLVNGASSPPMLFPPVAFSLNNKNHLLTDPAVLLSNPLLHVLFNIRETFPDKKLNIVSISNGGIIDNKYNYKYMFSFGLYGVYRYLFSTPTLSTKMYLEFMEELQKVNDNIAFYRIQANNDEIISPTNISDSNIKLIRQFADKMLQENYKLINDVADQLINRKFIAWKNREHAK